MLKLNNTWKQSKFYITTAHRDKGDPSLISTWKSLKTSMMTDDSLLKQKKIHICVLKLDLYSFSLAFVKPVSIKQTPQL
jgi:hypothetical protein